MGYWPDVPRMQAERGANVVPTPLRFFGLNPAGAARIQFGLFSHLLAIRDDKYEARVDQFVKLGENDSFI